MSLSRHRWIALASLVATVAGLAGGIVYLHDYYMPESVAEVDQPFPGLTLQDLDGRPVDLENYHGKSLLASFVQVDCHHCRNQLSMLEALHREIPGKNLTFIAISTDPPEETAVFFKQHPISFLVWIDTNRNLYKKLGVFNVPALFFLDENGILHHKAVGYQSANVVRETIDDLLQISVRG